MKGIFMKRMIVAVACCVLMGVAGMGCSTLQTAVTGVENFVTGTVVPDVCDAATYYANYVEGVVVAAESIPAVGTAITPIVNEANAIVAKLQASCANGTELSAVTNDLSALSNLIGQMNTAVTPVPATLPTGVTTPASSTATGS